MRMMGDKITVNSAYSDLVVAAPHAIFGLPEVHVGLYAMSGGLSRIVRIVGLPFASELALTGRQICAEEASQRGLINSLQDTVICRVRGSRICQRDSQQVSRCYHCNQKLLTGRIGNGRQAGHGNNEPAI